MVFDMYDYALQTVDLYKSITGLEKVKHAATPFVVEGSISSQDEQARGELAPNACGILMKALWLGRLSRPDIVKPINDLATKVQNWSRADDKRLLRLIQYIAATPHYRLVGTVNDSHLKIWNSNCMSMQTLQVRSLMPVPPREDFLFSEELAHSSHWPGSPKGRPRLPPQRVR